MTNPIPTNISFFRQKLSPKQNSLSMIALRS